MTQRLTTDQVARRLGVKTETVYAYVSRGLLHRTRDPGGRGSWFDATEVERMAARRTDRAGAGPSIRTGLTLIRDGRLFYRGADAAALAESATFEAVAAWLWSGRWQPRARFRAAASVVEAATAAVAPLPAGARLTDRLRTIVNAAACADPGRFRVDPDAVAATGAAVLAAMVDALPLVGTAPAGADRIAAPAGADRIAAPAGADRIAAPAGADRIAAPAGADRIAARLWPRLSAQPPEPAAVDALNAALVLLADHDLAASTVAARVAASTRAHPYAVVAAGLAAFDGPLHGAAASQAHRLLADVIDSDDPAGVYAERLRTEGRVPGFLPHVHRLYPDGDVRARTLLAVLPDAPAVRRAVEGLVAAAGPDTPPNIELALAALAHAGGMRADAGEAIFAIARTAGWIAHAMEEYEEPALRFRFTGSYVGPAPE